MSCVLEIFQCKNCGECCGPVMADSREIKDIKEYLQKQPADQIERIKSQSKPILTCIFRDTDNKRCFIHQVRPQICRMQGFYEGLPCKYNPGNATKSREEGYSKINYNSVRLLTWGAVM